MNGSFYVLLSLVAALLVLAWLRDPALIPRGLSSTGTLLKGVWPQLLLGFLLAGLLDVLLPQSLFSRWLGAERPWRALWAGSIAGLLLPGGPYVAFPMAAGLLQKGAAPGAVIAFITAKTLLSLTRTFTYELPLLGWRLTLARILPALALPPLLGMVGQSIFNASQPEPVADSDPLEGALRVPADASQPERGQRGPEARP